LPRIECAIIALWLIDGKVVPGFVPPPLRSVNVNTWLKSPKRSR
jgi:hypothetical protein